MATVVSLPPDSLPPDSQPHDSLPPEAGPALDSQPLPLLATPDAAASNDRGHARARPQHIGRYEVRSTLGSGGLGQVFEGWDPLLSRTVAIKTLQFDASAAERATLDRLFLDEARAVAKLSHPHIVTVHDAGLSQQGVWIAMERLHGRDLREALAGGWRPSAARAAQLVRRIADALAYAHAHGVVHCDIKPANIHLNDRGKPKVLDFGIARLLQENGAAADLPSSFGGSIAGSPHHLAPEQWSRGKIDPRTDIYALGTLFYELLAGRKAFMGDSVEQIRTAVELGHPAPPHELRREVPPELSAIAMRAMARLPVDRYGTAQELAQALRRWLEQQHPASSEATEPRRASNAVSTATAASSPSAAAATGWRRWLPAALLAAVIGVVTVIVLMATGTQQRQATDAAPAADNAPTTTAPALAVAPTPTASSAADIPPIHNANTSPTPEAIPVVPATAPMATATATPMATATASDAASRPATPAANPNPRPRPRVGAPAATVGAPEASSSVAPPPVLGSVQLAISPWGEVEVDGQPRGTTPPLSRLELPLGSHRITVRNSDFPAHTVTVQVAADQPAFVRHRFNTTP